MFEGIPVSEIFLPMSFWDISSGECSFIGRRFIDVKIIRIPIREIANEVFFMLC